jgi:hypothetical protein
MSCHGRWSLFSNDVLWLVHKSIHEHMIHGFELR